MPQIHTPRPQDHPGRHGEFLVAKWLCELSEHGLHLWFNVNYLRGVGEIDVILAHPELGFVVCEVKGFPIKDISGYRPDGFIEYGEFRRKNPALQAQEQAQKLKGWLSTRSKGRTNPWVHSLAWWPNIARNDWVRRFGPESLAAQHSENMVFSEDMSTFQAFANLVERITAEPLFGIKPPQRAMQIQADAFRHFTGELISQSEAERPVSDEQHVSSSPVRRGFSDAVSLPEHWNEKNLLIQGPVGSGKTATLLRVGFEHLKLGRRVIYSCFNKTLAAELRRHIGLLDQMPAQAEFVAFDFFELAKFLQPNLRGGNASEYLQRAAESSLVDQSDPFDVILIDEAQDMSDEAWKLLMGVSSRATYLSVAFGKNQELYAKQSCPSLEAFKKRARKSSLQRRFRNGVQSFFVSQAFYQYMESGAKADSLTNAMEWASSRYRLRRESEERRSGQPQLDLGELQGLAEIATSSTHSVADDVRELVKLMATHTQKDPVNSFILVNSSSSQGYLEAVSTLEKLGLPFHDVVDPQNRRISAPRSSISVSTVHSARGLEKDYVLVCDFERTCAWSQPENPALGRNLAYIALTRARRKTLVSREGAGGSFLDALQRFIAAHNAGYS